MNEEEIIKKLDDIWNNCEEIDNHNLETERAGYKMYDDYIFVRNGIKRLHSIIKEVREYIKNLREDDEYLEELHFSYEDKYKLLEILDKENKGEDKE